MRITFIGSSHGYPEPNRKTSCTLIEACGKKYLIDIGCDSAHWLVTHGMDPDQLRAVFITHMHSDHISGLFPLIGMYAQKIHMDFYVPDPGIKDILIQYNALAHNRAPDYLNFIKVEEGVIFDDGTVRVTALRTGHFPNPPYAYAYIVESEGKRVLFSGDMKAKEGPKVDFARFLAQGPFDIAIGECAHFPCEEYLDVVRANPPKRFIINHYSPRYTEGCWSVKNVLGREMQVDIANDDMIIDV